MEARAFQDDLHWNYCWGCGSLNEHGLHLKSHWAGADSVCTFRPGRHHAAGPRHVLNGGIIATVIDCHSVCTAVAAAYRADGRPIGSEPIIWYVTGTLHVVYRRPAGIDREITVRARIKETTERKMVVASTVFSGDEEVATGEVVAIRVDPTWLAG